MSSVAQARPLSLTQRMGGFERHLTLWVVLCMVAGTLLGYLFQSAFAQLGATEIAKVRALDRLAVETKLQQVSESSTTA